MVAAVSSVGLAFIHEYIALDPLVKIVILKRPINEVVSSFMVKSKGRNHWQNHQHNTDTDEIRDKTWDRCMPNMSYDECRRVMDDDPLVTNEEKEGQRPHKACAIRAYCNLYYTVAYELEKRYPNNVKIYDMHTALNDIAVQEDLLKWCGLSEVVLDTHTHLNKKQ